MEESPPKGWGSCSCSLGETFRHSARILCFSEQISSTENTTSRRRFPSCISMHQDTSYMHIHPHGYPTRYTWKQEHKVNYGDPWQPAPILSFLLLWSGFVKQNPKVYRKTGHTPPTLLQVKHLIHRHVTVGSFVKKILEFADKPLKTDSG